MSKIGAPLVGVDAPSAKTGFLNSRTCLSLRNTRYHSSDTAHSIYGDYYSLSDIVGDRIICSIPHLHQISTEGTEFRPATSADASHLPRGLTASSALAVAILDQPGLISVGRRDETCVHLPAPPSHPHKPSTTSTPSHPLASTLLAALKYNPNKLNVPAIQTRLLARELFSVVVRTYSTLYNTLNPMYTPVYAFSVAISSSAHLQP
jgi:hypothetical protein